MALDGYPRTVMAINGQIPGPTLYADWGDTVRVHVRNSLSRARNGTSIHWHGMRQLNTNQEDGVCSITQCPTAPGHSMTNEWLASRYGTSWYHSHIGLQAWEGVLGSMVINGPATANYDVDVGPIFLSDWSHKTVDELYQYAQTVGPPKLDTGLINGTNVYDGKGLRFQLKVKEGTSYRLRLVNGAIDTQFKFMIDNHTMTVISSDYVPVNPFQTDVLNVGIGRFPNFVSQPATDDS